MQIFISTSTDLYFYLSLDLLTSEHLNNTHQKANTVRTKFRKITRISTLTFWRQILILLTKLQFFKSTCLAISIFFLPITFFDGEFPKAKSSTVRCENYIRSVFTKHPRKLTVNRLRQNLLLQAFRNVIIKAHETCPNGNSALESFEKIIDQVFSTFVFPQLAFFPCKFKKVEKEKKLINFLFSGVVCGCEKLKDPV